MEEEKKEEVVEENVLKKNRNKTFFSSVRNALNGIIHVFKTERNLRVDYLIGAIVFFVSIFFGFTKTEFVCLTITIGFVIFAEMINSTVEYVVDLITEEYNEKAKAAKDIAAGGVLISGIIAVIVAYFLFIGKIKEASMAILESVLNSKLHMLVTILFIVCLLTVILKGVFTKKRTDYVKSFPSSRITVSFALATYLLVITRSLLVGGVTFALCVIISSLKRENDKTTIAHVILSALLGILLVLILYQLTLLKPFLSLVDIKL